MGKIYGYCRVSTIGQAKNGNSVEDQRAQLAAKGAGEIIVDTYTGTKIDRPNLSLLLAKLQPGDTLIVTKLDRLARNAAEGSTLVKKLVDKGITVNILNMGVADNSSMGVLMLNILFAFAEYERDMIVERTQTGKAIARARGVRVDGRPPKYTPKQLDHAMSLLENHSYNQVADLTGISRSTLLREAKKRREKGGL